MKWATREMIHFDRVASAWLILRFVDRDAQFMFLKIGEVPEEDSQPFGVPGVQLAAHDGKTTTFQRILDAYRLTDSALVLLGRVVADTVAHVMNDQSRLDLSKRDGLVGGVLAMAEGALLLSATDSECLARCVPMYDALLARIRAQIALDRIVGSAPASVLDQTRLIANAGGELRQARTVFSDDAFAEALRLSKH